MRITDVQPGSSVEIWLKPSAAAVLLVGKDNVPYYEFRYPTRASEYQMLVGKVVTNNTQTHMLTASVIPGGAFYVPIAGTYSGLVTIPYLGLKQLRIKSERAEYPPLTRYNSDRYLRDGLTYHTSEAVVLAW